jgi:hypothetical protein
MRPWSSSLCRGSAALALVGVVTAGLSGAGAMAMPATAAQAVISAGGGQDQPGAPVAGTGTAAISGVVIDASSGRPLEGAVVTLASHPRLASRAVARMQTDALGRFVFARLPAGNQYYLHASRFGYFDGGLGREIPGSTEGRPIPLTDGQWLRDVELRMLRPAAVSGTIIDEAGEPMVGVPVRVLPVITLAGVEHVANGLIARTDDRGAYRIAGLAPGRYLISVPSVQGAVPGTTTPFELAGVTEQQFASAERAGRAPAVPPTVPVAGEQALVVGAYPTPPSPRGTPRAYPPTYYPAARAPGDAVAIEPGPGGVVAGIDIQLQPVPAVPVSGRVTGPPEALAGLVLRLMTPGSEGVGVGSEVATSRVARDGAFTFVNVPVGRYTLLADRTILQYHYTPMGSNLDTTLPDPAGFDRSRGGAGQIPGAAPGVGYDFASLADADASWGRADVTVAESGVAGLVLELRPTVAIRGRVVWEGGVPKPPTFARMTPSGMETGLAETLPVSAEPADGDAALGMPRGDYVIATERFEVGGLRPGEYLLRIQGAPAVKSIVWNGRDYTDRPFDASAGHDFDEVVVTVTDQTAAVSGAVREAGGAPAAAGHVLAFPTDERFWSRFGFEPARLQSAPIRQDGTYTLALPAGEYFLAAVAGIGRDGWRVPSLLRSLAAGATRIQVDWGDEVSESLTIAGGGR